MVDLTIMAVNMVTFAGLPKVNQVIMAKNVQSLALPNVMGMTCFVLEDTI